MRGSTARTSVRPPAWTSVAAPVPALATAMALAVVLAVTPALSAGQVTDVSFGGGAGFELYSFSDAQQVGLESISLATLPFGARATVASDVDVQLFGNVARGSLTRTDGSDATLFGLTDTDVQVDYTVGGVGGATGENTLTLTGVVSLPTGSATHDAEEAAVAGAVAADLLPFRISNWGRGGGVALQAAGARSFENFGAGLSLAYRVSGDFEPREANEFTYQPGNELRVRLALDRELGTGGKGSLVLGFQNFSDDAVDGTNVFQSGSRFNATGSYAFPAVGRGAGVVYAGVIHRSNGTFLQGATSSDTPSQDLVLLGSQLRIPWGSTRVKPRVDGRLFRTEDGRGQGYVAGVGVSMDVPRDRITWMPSVTARFGNLEAVEGRESSFTGFEIGVRARFQR